jgi:hypothetical protein
MTQHNPISPEIRRKASLIVESYCTTLLGDFPIPDPERSLTSTATRSPGFYIGREHPARDHECVHHGRARGVSSHPHGGDELMTPWDPYRTPRTPARRASSPSVRVWKF